MTDSPYGNYGDTVLLQALRIGITTRLTLEHLERAGVDVLRDPHSFIADSAIVRLNRQVMAEELPGTAKTVVFDDPRWATWWDHLKATYRDRWWAAWWVRRRPPRTTLTPVRGHVNVRSWWVYPDTPHLLAPGLGYSVLKTDTTYGQ